MINSRLLAVFASLLLLAGGLAHAEGDPQAGKSKAGACAACHGPDGNSNSPQFPNLAGQHADYVYAQLKHFKSGERQNAIMAGQVANLSDQDMQDLAAYFSSLSMEVNAADKSLADQGEHIWRGGVPERNVPACSGCHGPTGAGMEGAGYPRIGGQKATYLVTQLQAYSAGKRSGYPKAEIMTAVASRLSDDQIKAVASFASGLYRKTDGESASGE
ncbi:Cytochrome c4 [wastewater metagenome]|uniref:Cytochrome c4 n=2 Tax=unclassified sequences TaxID=12908 RepID=A0A5B8RBJ4_9ZZZZ|nr:cytochrome c4 [uncultured organism]